MINLSPSQSAIVTAPIGHPMQVLASAGSGKTRVLTERIRYILNNTQKDGVIALTFTNKAAEEMLARLDDVEGVEERCWIGTIHSVAQRILTQYGHTIGLPSELHIYEREQDRKTVFLQSLQKDGLDVDYALNISDEIDKKGRDKIIQNYLEQFSVVKRELLTEDEVKKKYNDDKFWNLYRAYQEALLQGGGIDFDDILVYAHRILLLQSWCGKIYRAKYKHICVDESQDLNKAQYEFIKALCGDEIKSVMMVGDPNQMIYGFNGSSSAFLCIDFVVDFAPLKCVLKENYRSSRAVIHLANKLKPGSQIQGETDFAIQGRFTFEALDDEDFEAKWICDTIASLLKEATHTDIEGEIALTKMVVIARNRFVFQTLEAKLKEINIPYSLKKGERLAEPASIFGKVLDFGIRLKLNPKDWVDGKKLCDTLKITYPKHWGDEKLLAFFAEEVKKSDILFPDLQSDLLCFINSLDIENPQIPKLVKTFIEIINETVSTTTSSIDELERALQELTDFQNNWTSFRIKGLGESLSAFRNAMALGQLSEEFNSTGLTLSTVHTMKGLEKDIVFLMGMCEGIFPDYRAKTKKEIEEELNNAFVAVTRSRRWIYITYPKKRKMPWGDFKSQMPSRFLTTMQLS